MERHRTWGGKSIKKKKLWCGQEDMMGSLG